MMEHYYEATTRIQKTIPAILYHYCPTDKLHFLLEPGADLCCRYLTCQGDKEEYRFGASLLCDYIRSKGLQYRSVGDVIETNLVENIGCVGMKMVGPIIPLTFSLTERIDSRHHYKEYCKDDGCAIAFNQERLDSACGEALKRGLSLRLIRCYYEGRNDAEILTLCESFWQDQFSNLERIRQSNYSDVEVGKRVLSEICCIAPHFKRRTYLEDNEWRIVMVSQVWEDVDEHGFRASGLRDVTLHGDLIDLMEGVAVQRGRSRNNVMCELGRFALQQRKPDFKVWV